MKRHADAVLIGVLMMAGFGCGDDGGGTSSATNGSDATTADKDGMGASVGDTGVFGTLEVTVNADSSVLKFATADGWTVDFSKYLVTVGAFHASAETGDPTADDHTFVVDLQAIVGSEYLLTTFDRVSAGRYTSVGFALPTAGSKAAKAPSTSQADLDLMVKTGYSVYIEGVMTRTDGADGQSCTPGAPKDCAPAKQIALRWGYRAGTAYDQCADFAVTDGETTTVDLLMSAEGWFMPGFGPGPNFQTQSRAQWIADADLNRDGETTLAELEEIKASDLFAAGYDLSGAPIEIVTAYDFTEAQARNLGRNSYGYCKTSRAL